MRQGSAGPWVTNHPCLLNDRNGVGLQEILKNGEDFLRHASASGSDGIHKDRSGGCLRKYGDVDVYKRQTLKCGTRPFRIPGFTADGTPNGDSFRVPKPDPVLPAGMSWKQYGLLRERVGIWVVSQGTAGAPVLDAAEVALLKAHQAVLMPYADYFSMKAMDYLNWGDVASWR